MKAFKFIVHGETELPRYPGQPPEVTLSVENCIAVVLAEDEAQARQIMKDTGDDVRWLAVAKVIVFEIDKARFIAGANY